MLLTLALVAVSVAATYAVTRFIFLPRRKLDYEGATGTGQEEAKARADELQECLAQQAATSEILRVISGSPGNLTPVSDSILGNSMRLCEAQLGMLFMYEGDAFTAVAMRGASAAAAASFRSVVRPGPATGLGRLLVEKRPVHIPDILDDDAYRAGDPVRTATVELLGARTFLAVPLSKDDVVRGALVIYRREVQPFSEGQVRLVQTFADQALIAIENARLFREIEQKSRELEVVSKHKSQFLANMSHELRTPLNAILGYTELIVDRVYGEVPEKIVEVLERVQGSGRHLLGLINDVLDLSKIEAGQLELTLSEYSFNDVVQTVANALGSLAAEKQLRLRVDVAADLPIGQGDERRITQVLLNLVGNAIKFTDHGEVALRVSAADGAFLAAVADTGPGIKAQDQEKIFDEFQQSDASPTKSKTGTGLGLAIARRLVDLHGGRIWVESTLGKGATFYVSIPVVSERSGVMQ